METLPERMRQAANVLIQATSRQNPLKTNAAMINESPWTPASLRYSADRWEEEERLASDERKRLRLDIMDRVAAFGAVNASQVIDLILDDYKLVPRDGG